MSKLNEDTERYCNMFKNKNFTEKDFVGLLLPLLCKNGVCKVDEEQLKKVLYCYYEKPEYREIFTDICPYRGSFSEELDIHDGLYNEKNFSGSVTWDVMHPNILNLHYSRDIDLSRYEQELSENGIMLMHKIVEELSLRHKIELGSKHKMVIYGCNPNKSYILTHGQHIGTILSWELLTDGIIKNIDYPKFEEMKHCFFNSPDCPKHMIQLEQNHIANVTLENASYAVMQGLNNRKIRHLEVFTNIDNFEQLRQISDIANTEYTTADNLLTREEPYVRKLVLR